MKKTTTKTICMLCGKSHKKMPKSCATKAALLNRFIDRKIPVHVVLHVVEAFGFEGVANDKIFVALIEVLFDKKTAMQVYEILVRSNIE